MKTTTHPPPAGAEVAWRCTMEDHVVIVRARLAFDARREACRRLYNRGVLCDEQDIMVTLIDDGTEGRNGKRVHVLAVDYEFVGTMGL